ncbi:YciI family protein [Streptomyces sp. NPDC017979]|uniref:YciI family protein n=1 Tax=unclassified Streptomyces TaxID=2593676 RepID=UPI0037B86B38
MFVLELTYTAPAERVDAVRAAHMSWVDDHYADGLFLASGRKGTRDGGVVLAAGDDRARIDAVVASDPFVLAGVCAYRITHTAVTRTVPGLEPLRGESAG